MTGVKLPLPKIRPSSLQAGVSPQFGEEAQDGRLAQSLNRLSPRPPFALRLPPVAKSFHLTEEMIGEGMGWGEVMTHYGRRRAEMNGGSQSQTLGGQRFVIVSVSRRDDGCHGASVSFSLRGLEEFKLKKLLV